MNQMTITTAILALGHGADGWAANERDGILVWNLDAPQPTEKELIDAGWVPHTESEVIEPEVVEDSVPHVEALAEETQA